jgi:hypothetical protein
MIGYEIDTDNEISVEISHAVSEFEGRPLESLPSLSSTVDLDALDRLWHTFGPFRSDVQVSFEYSESEITIQNGQYLTVEST